MAAKCLVKFERARGGKIDAVMYSRRTGYALNAIQGMFAPLSVSAARRARELLMRGCAELDRPIRRARRVALGRSRRGRR